MSKLDDAIHQALTEEDKDFLARFEKEPNSIEQMTSVFRGPLAWIYIAFVIAAVILAPIGLFALVQFINATELRPLFHWGLATVGILVILSVVRMVFFMQINTNRVLRELKRLELQVARLAVRGDK